MIDASRFSTNLSDASMLLFCNCISAASALGSSGFHSASKRRGRPDVTQALRRPSATKRVDAAPATRMQVRTVHTEAIHIGGLMGQAMNSPV
jgi:hypothetical protein